MSLSSSRSRSAGGQASPPSGRSAQVLPSGKFLDSRHPSALAASGAPGPLLPCQGTLHRRGPRVSPSQNESDPRLFLSLAGTQIFKIKQTPEKVLNLQRGCGGPAGPVGPKRFRAELGRLGLLFKKEMMDSEEGSSTADLHLKRCCSLHPLSDCSVHQHRRRAEGSDP